MTKIIKMRRNGWIPFAPNILIQQKLKKNLHLLKFSPKFKNVHQNLLKNSFNVISCFTFPKELTQIKIYHGAMCPEYGHSSFRRPSRYFQLFVCALIFLVNEILRFTVG